MSIPDSVKNYYDAQWWIFIHAVPLMYPAIVICGIIAWLHQFYDENREEKSAITVLNLGHQDPDSMDVEH